ncbi:hypothetical protein AOA57_00020, partial [Pseudomonas sp. 2588-5]
VQDIILRCASGSNFICIHCKVTIGINEIIIHSVNGDGLSIAMFRYKIADGSNIIFCIINKNGFATDLSLNELTTID